MIEADPNAVRRVSDASMASKGESSEVAISIPPQPVEVRELNEEEAYALFEARAQELLGMSAEAFLAAWDSGEFGDMDDDQRVVAVAMLMPRGW